MVLSKRERTIAWVAAAVLGLLAADRFFLTPELERRSEIEAETANVLVELERSTSVLAGKRRLLPRWREMADSGLGAGAGSAESRFLHAIRDWAQESDLNLTSVKLERSEAERQFQKISWRASGTGTMAAVSAFLWRIQESSLPVRISDVQITARQDGVDSLSLQVGVSTLCRAERGGAKASAEEPSAGAPAVPEETP